MDTLRPTRGGVRMCRDRRDRGVQAGRDRARAGGARRIWYPERARKSARGKGAAARSARSVPGPGAPGGEGGGRRAARADGQAGTCTGRRRRTPGSTPNWLRAKARGCSCNRDAERAPENRECRMQRFRGVARG